MSGPRYCRSCGEKIAPGGVSSLLCTNCYLKATHDHCADGAAS